MWHWEMKCPKYPGGKGHETILRAGSDVEISYQIPRNDRLCPSCVQIEANEKNRLQSKEMLRDDDLV